MLVLSRKVGQRISIAANIDVTVLEIRGDVVRLGIAAPLEISVHRVEKTTSRQDGRLYGHSVASGQQDGLSLKPRMPSPESRAS